MSVEEVGKALFLAIIAGLTLVGSVLFVLAALAGKLDNPHNRHSRNEVN